MRTNLSLVLVVAAASVAFGQAGGFIYQPTFSSTVEEGAQRGAADLVRSKGMANLLNSMAATEFEQARKSYIDNRLKATQTYFDMKRVNDEYRRAKDTSPLSMEQYVRLARVQAPDQLGTSQLDPLTGAIGWPGPLRRPEYAELRKKLDELFHQRAAGYVDYSALISACEEFLTQLKNDLPKFPPSDYLTARKFLDSLAFAARTTQT
jgi:hypothetical protein